MRNLCATLILIGTLGLSGPSLARDISLPKHSAAEIKTVCDKVGGKFSQDANGYDCGTNCHGGPGTDCIVSCKTAERCVAQVIGARRPRHVLDALKMPERHAR